MLARLPATLLLIFPVAGLAQNAVERSTITVLNGGSIVMYLDPAETPSSLIELDQEIEVDCGRHCQP